MFFIPTFRIRSLFKLWDKDPLTRGVPMKTVIFSLSLMIGAFSHAELVNLPDKTIGIYSVSGAVESTRPLCPKGMTCVANGTIINLTYTASGCMDTLIQQPYIMMVNEVVVHAQMV